ncbi:hypothetical protein ACWDV4_04925 [Micromonospora sp. NPDC003197]
MDLLDIAKAMLLGFLTPWPQQRSQRSFVEWGIGEAMKQISPRSRGLLALMGAVMLIIAGLLSSAVVANAAAPAKKGVWKFDLRTTDSAQGGRAAGSITWKKSGRCYKGKIDAFVSDMNDSDKHGAIATFTYVDCKTKKVKTTRIKTTSKSRHAAVTVFLNNARDARVLLCLYQGTDIHRYCNTKGAI